MTDEPKKGISIKQLMLRAKPQATVICGTNTIHLYPANAGDLDEFKRLSAGGGGDALVRFRGLLPRIASLVNQAEIQEKRDPLPSEIVEQLSADELEAIADAYVAIAAFKDVRTDKGESAVVRLEGESAIAYLERLLIAMIEQHRHTFEKLYLDAMSPASRLLEKVNSSSFTLGESLKAYEKLSVPGAVQFETINTQAQDLFRATNEHHSRIARERKEELEMSRLTGEMTAQSAKLLQDLTKAASDFLLRFDARSDKADKDTRHQLKIAVWSVAVSAVLALFALGIGIASYVQDGGNNVANDKLQSNILKLQSTESEKRIQIERELESLRAQVVQLEKQRSAKQSGAQKGHVAVGASEGVKGGNR